MSLEQCAFDSRVTTRYAMPMHLLAAQDSAATHLQEPKLREGKNVCQNLCSPSRCSCVSCGCSLLGLTLSSVRAQFDAVKSVQVLNSPCCLECDVWVQGVQGICSGIEQIKARVDCPIFHLGCVDRPAELRMRCRADSGGETGAKRSHLSGRGMAEVSGQLSPRLFLELQGGVKQDPASAVWQSHRPRKHPLGGNHHLASRDSSRSDSPCSFCLQVRLGFSDGPDS